MSRLWKIILKLIFSIGVAIAILYKFGDTFAKAFEGHGAFYTFLGAVGAGAALAGMIYTAITIFIYCFTNQRFVLFFDGLPIPFVMKIVAGLAGIFGWVWLVSFLGDKFGGSTAIFDAIALIVLYPFFFWIDLVLLFIERHS